MASVTLTKVWLQDAADPSDYVQLTGTDLSEVPLANAPIRRYAGGRYRLITTPGIQSLYRLTVRAPTRTEANQIRTWTGSLLLLRDQMGRAVYGRYENPNFRESPQVGVNTVFQIDLAFEEVTHSPAV